MKSLRLIIIGIVIVGGAWLAWNSSPDLRDLVSQYVDNSDINSLEAQYSPEEIMKEHEKELLKDKSYSFRDPSVKYFPFLLLDVKYTQPDKKTKEGQLLWSLTDGEIILNTESWEKTHGFQDSLNANANRTDFRIMNAIARHKGVITIDELSKELHLDTETLDPWIESARQKQLIVQRGNQLQLHFENPKIAVLPESKINHWIVTKPSSLTQKGSRKYSKNQIERLSKAAFGNEFTIRDFKEIYIPVYSIEVQNPDGSTFVSLWNALTGEKW